MQALKDKIALITGGSTGIGFATARRFLDEGARVVLTGRTQETLDKALAELDAPERALGVRGDVARLTDLDRLFKTFGRPEEVAAAVLFLATDASSFVVGVDLVVDGGFQQT